MHRKPFPSRPVGALRRAATAMVLVSGTGLAAAACGSSSPSGSAAPASATATGSCAGVPGAHHARLVVETAPGKVLQRCVGFAGASIPAVTLITDSHVETGTQDYSGMGVAFCQVDHVPAHYSQCLSSGQDYWALFLSSDGHHWTSPSTGASQVSVPAGGSLGLRYDPPTGTPAPPPSPTPAT